jgi:pimeloyl-ACP methyl ester carboxylesterase
MTAGSWMPLVRRFRNELVNLCSTKDRLRIDLVGHNFGTCVIGWALARLPKKKPIKINTIILAGSVLNPDLPCRDLLGSTATPSR